MHTWKPTARSLANQVLDGHIQQAGSIIFTQPIPNAPHPFNLALCIFLGRRGICYLVVRSTDGLGLALRLRMMRPTSDDGTSEGHSTETLLLTYT